MDVERDNRSILFNWIFRKSNFFLFYFIRLGIYKRGKEQPIILSNSLCCSYNPYAISSDSLDAHSKSSYLDFENFRANARFGGLGTLMKTIFFF